MKYGFFGDYPADCLKFLDSQHVGAKILECAVSLKVEPLSKPIGVDDFIPMNG